MGITPEAYSPLKSPGSVLLGGVQTTDTKNLLEEPIVKELAEKYGKTKGQIILNWGLMRGHVIIPKSSSKTRQIENLESCKFKLEKEDVDKLSALKCGDRWCDVMGFDDLGNFPNFC